MATANQSGINTTNLARLISASKRGPSMTGKGHRPLCSLARARTALPALTLHTGTGNVARKSVPAHVRKYPTKEPPWTNGYAG